MVVVHPDGVAIFNVLHDFFGEDIVCGGVGVPGVLVEGNFTWVVVEERPKDLIYGSALVTPVAWRKEIAQLARIDLLAMPL